jgi:hypothetical protein
VDPTLAAFIGAGFGAAVTALSPWLTGRMDHAAQRREVMREAYLQGMRAVAGLPRSPKVTDLERVKGELIEAQLHIHLVGSRRTSAKFSKLASVAIQWINGVLSAATEVSRIGVPEDFLRMIMPPEERAIVDEANEAFVAAARRDMGMEDSALTRLSQRLSRPLKKSD